MRPNARPPAWRGSEPVSQAPIVDRSPADVIARRDDCLSEVRVRDGGCALAGLGECRMKLTVHMARGLDALRWDARDRVQLCWGHAMWCDEMYAAGTPVVDWSGRML